MIAHCFIVFRQERRARAARLPLPHFGGDIWLTERRFHRWKSFSHFHHVVDNQRRLLGFQLDFLDSPPDAAPWWRWVESCENCSLKDNEFVALLADVLPEEYYPDSASIIGGDVYYDGAGEFIVVIPDMNEWKTPQRDWGQMWVSIGFDLGQLNARRESEDNDT